MKIENNIHQEGKSVIEMLIVVAIVGILVTFAVSQFGTSSSNLGRQNLAREFKVSLERARFDSVKRRAANPAHMARVVIDSPTRFRLITDLNQNGTIEVVAESRVTDFSNRTDVAIVGTDLVFPIRILFDRRGHSRVFNGASPPVEIAAEFVFCNNCSLLTANAQNANRLFISPTGTVAMMAGDETIPDFTPPNVSNVNSNIQVNPMLAIWDAEVIASPLPTVTPTPTPLGTPSGTPAGTPAGTPTPTPTPSPTPVACTVGQRPDSDNCQCIDPLYLHANGRCRSR